MSAQVDHSSANGTEATNTSSAKVSLAALVALVIGSMIGGGIFGLPQQMASSAAPGPLILGWILTGVGMLMLAFIFQRLAISRPEIDGGVYGYARAGFGDLVGSLTAWGYWLSAWVGNVGYLVLLMASLGVFFPGFGAGNTALAIGIASVILWLYHLLILRGIREAAIVNTIVTIGKVLPLLVFIIIGIFAFKFDVFNQDFWGTNSDLGSTIDQVKAMMLVTVWVFIGVEGASVFSERAKTRKDVGRATVIGFLSVMALLLAVNLLSYGILSRPELAELEDPSLAGVLEAAVGSWGAKFIALGLIISLVGALLSWFLMCAEIMRLPAQQGLLPKRLGEENRNGVPTGALWLTMICVQLVLIWTYFNDSTYTNLIYLASSLILLPYLFSALYQIKVAVQNNGKSKASDLLIGIFGAIYGVWLLYAAGLIYLLYTALFYVVGIPLFAWARREQNKPLFKTYEWVIVGAVVLMAIYAFYGLATGTMSI